jgi:hypothetical protein
MESETNIELFLYPASLIELSLDEELADNACPLEPLSF